jgi:hypothetical protein
MLHELGYSDYDALTSQTYFGEKMARSKLREDDRSASAGKIHVLWSPLFFDRKSKPGMRIPGLHQHPRFVCAF